MRSPSRQLILISCKGCYHVSRENEHDPDEQQTPWAQLAKTLPSFKIPMEAFITKDEVCRNHLLR